MKDKRNVLIVGLQDDAREVILEDILRGVLSKTQKEIFFEFKSLDNYTDALSFVNQNPVEIVVVSNLINLRRDIKPLSGGGIQLLEEFALSYGANVGCRGLICGVNDKPEDFVTNYDFIDFIVQYPLHVNDVRTALERSYFESIKTI